ncbi:hypothetical protein ACJRO7_011766 [Eucalyptus globulus]|uniref:Uncharacterized protein n=1 Tax=Eucalyptus globulus TaxID=34317 RepID=A0ABD3LG97_EUCGL
MNLTRNCYRTSNPSQKEAVCLRPTIPIGRAKVGPGLPHQRVYMIPEDNLLFVNIWAVAREPKVWANHVVQPREVSQAPERGVIGVKGRYRDPVVIRVLSEGVSRDFVCEAGAADDAGGDDPMLRLATAQSGRRAQIDRSQG